MNRLKIVGGITALSAMLLSSTAYADVTAREVWEGWRGYMSGFGYDIDAKESTSGKILTVSDLVLSMKMPDDAGDITFVTPEMTFQNQDDGTVLILIPQAMPLNFKATSKKGEKIDATVVIDYTGLSMVASGSVEDITYTYNASEISANLSTLVVDGTPMANVGFEMAMINILGRSKLAMADLVNISQKISAEQLVYSVKATDLDTGGKVDISGSIKDMEFDGSAQMPQLGDASDTQAMFNAGFAFESTMRHGDISGKVAAQDNNGPFTLDIAASSGDFGASLDRKNMHYSGSSNDIALNATGGKIPLPVSANISEFSYSFKMPLAKSETPQDFAFDFTLGGLTISDLLWGIFDASGVLPRDPATLAIDLNGQATLLMDLMSPEIEAMEHAPAELNALTLNNLVLEVAGAKIKGAGDFTFDNSDMISFDGLPRPLGAIDLNAKGLNGLIDKLVTMGLLPVDQANGGRMMLGLFSVPVAGSDELNSKIEVNKQGHVLANGQRIK